MEERKHRREKAWKKENMEEKKTWKKENCIKKRKNEKTQTRCEHKKKLTLLQRHQCKCISV